jgi:hypothetical protein
VWIPVGMFAAFLATLFYLYHYCFQEVVPIFPHFFDQKAKKMGIKISVMLEDFLTISKYFVLVLTTPCFTGEPWRFKRNS